MAKNNRPAPQQPPHPFDAKLNAAERSVIRVGFGRGFIVQHHHVRIVITAAHCLPAFPPPMTISYTAERTYPKLLGPLHGRRSVWAECLFADPIGDIAVLGPPDDQAFAKESEAYEQLVDAQSAVEINDVSGIASAWILSLTKGLLPCTMRRSSQSIVLSGLVEGTRNGMSGSPIIDNGGYAVGIVVASQNAPQSYLMGNLPGWLLRDLSQPSSSAE